MYGFLITRGVPPQETRLENPRVLACGDIHFYYSPLPKFENDHLFYEDDEKIVLIDGVVFNNHELMESRGLESWREVMDLLIREDPRTFQKELRGSFCGALLKKRSGEMVIFTNQSGEKAVYYARREGLFFAASHNNILTAALKNQGLPVEPDLQAHRELLCAGAILHGKTPFQGIRRITAGKCLRIDAGAEYQEQQYHMFRNIPEHELSLDACVEEMDKRFRKAVDRIFSKNKEYGYQSECDLSGGLDSRMVTWVAHDLGYQNILNVCYCQSENIDHTTSKKIAADLGNGYLFLPLDGGEYLMDIDERVNLFGGQLTFLSSAGSYRASIELAKRNVGVSATGLLGELIKADFTEGVTHTAPRYTHLRYSEVVPLEVSKEHDKDYDNYEQYNLYEYLSTRVMSSAIMRQQVCEVASPIIDVDFLEFAYRIPLRWRKDCLLMMTWMVQKYPQAAKYVWQAKRMPVENVYHHRVYWPKAAADIKRFAIRCVNKVGRELNLPVQLPVVEDMIPYETWYRMNSKLHKFINQYFTQNIGRIQDEELKHDLEITFERGNARDKLQALNILSLYKLYF